MATLTQNVSITLEIESENKVGEEEAALGAKVN
jgi:hypothetical protein